VRARSLAPALAAAALLGAAPAEAHEEHPEHGRGGSDGAAVQVAPSPPGPMAFAPPEAGSYALPPLGAAGDGPVLTSDGAATRLHRVFGERVVLLSFVYTSCGDASGCPLATATFHRLQRRLEDAPGLAERLRLVTLSFDPARDTPEAMRRYGAPFRRGGLDWHFLTTRSEQQLAPLLEAYGQHVVREADASGKASGALSHVLRVFLIDRRRRIRNVYSADFLHAELLLNDVRTVLGEGGAERAAPAAAEGEPERREAGAAATGPGDVRAGYESADWRTRSRALDARPGEALGAAALAARAADPPLGLPPVPVPGDNPVTPEKVALGRRLFFERRLSGNGTFSCAMCHVPEQGFAHNETATAVGIEGRTVRRNAPTILNAAYVSRLFHDGRETRLEHQIWAPLLARNEMGNVSIGAVLETLRSVEGYPEAFEAAFPGRGIALETVGMAIASYERTLVSGGSPFDRWHFGGEEDAVGEGAARGFALFTGRAGCSGCHTLGAEEALFSDGSFHNTGVGFEAAMAEGGATQRVQVAPGRWLEVDRSLIASVSEPRPGDLGRYEVTGRPQDRWRYRTPGLRNVALTAPYMHDGSLATLREVVRFYARGGVPNPGLDPRIRPLELSEREVDDLVAFLRSLTGGDVAALVADAGAAPIGDPGAGPAAAGR